ncbi:hypothetical protein M8J75_013608 [Diaphorina citri]|nr:hypothetical protein M8J75_013608 [Diaphorina citri]
MRQWLRLGQISKLEQILFHGQGHKLLTEHSSNPRTLRFLKAVPQYMAKINKVHEIVTKGDLKELQNLLKPTGKVDNTKLLTSKDVCGEGLLHKAVCRGYFELIQWLLNTCPGIVHVKDKFDRTALHYAPLCPDPDLAWTTLIQAGVNPKCKDKFGKMAKFYMDNPSMIKLSRSPWEKDPGRYTSANQAFTIKPSNIRIWIHDQDLNRLLRVIWEGHGSKLLSETSRQPTVKRFLESIPFILGTVRDIHQSVIQNNLPQLMKVSAEPVPVEALSSKDMNGLTPLHKGSGLGFKDIVDYLLTKVDNVNQADSFGRTPLHYAALKSENTDVYKLLKSRGAIENIQDSKGKLPKHYLTKPNDRPEACLSFVPSAPRTVDLFPMSWDWDLYKTKPRVMLKSRSSLQAEKEGEEYIATRKTKSEGNLHKLPVKRKVKKMFEEDFVGPKNKTNTLNLEKYKQGKAGRKQQRHFVEDTTDSDVEDNVHDAYINHHRGRSKTIGGPLTTRTNKIDTGVSHVKKIDKNDSDVDIGVRNIQENTNNTTDAIRNYVNETNQPNKDTVDEDHPSDRKDYRTSYRNYPLFDDPILNDLRQPFSSNYGTRGALSKPAHRSDNANYDDTRLENENTNEWSNNKINDKQKSGKREKEENDAGRENLTPRRKEEFIDESSSFGNTSSPLSANEAPGNNTGNDNNKEHKRRKRHLKTDDARIIVNTFNSIEDMQKSIQDEAEEKEKENFSKEKDRNGEPKEIEDLKENSQDHNSAKLAKKENIEGKIIVNTFNSIEDMRNILEGEVQKVTLDVKDELQIQGNTSANENVSENNASDGKTERYNELYYEQKSTVDLFEQNGLPTNNRDGEMKDDIDLSEFDNVSFSKLIKNRTNSTNHLRERNGTSEKVVHTDEGVNKPGSAGERNKHGRGYLEDDDDDAILRNTYNLNLIDNRDVDHILPDEPGNDKNENVADAIDKDKADGEDTKLNDGFENNHIDHKQHNSTISPSAHGNYTGNPTSVLDKNGTSNQEEYPVGNDEHLSDDNEDDITGRNKRDTKKDDENEDSGEPPHSGNQNPRPWENSRKEDPDLWENSRNPDSHPLQNSSATNQHSHPWEHFTNRQPHLLENPRNQIYSQEEGLNPDDIKTGEAFDDGVRYEMDRNELDDYNKERRIDELIEEGDLEKLADLILEGDGDLLRGKRSQHSEVQRFLTNVPSYMAKIKKIHLACQKGDLREVLHNLDRRKFAVGRENWSGLRMTPLHTSVLYRNSAIVRYLAGRFPESLHARDIHGRTPLHYAGTLPDKTFYNLLLTLGAYQTLLDNKGLAPSDYIESKVTCYSSLVALYENNPEIYEMEKNRSVLLFFSELEASRDLVSASQTSALFISEEGRYLASAIGDPLIQGLREIIKERPMSPVKFLANFLIQYEQQRNSAAPIENGAHIPDSNMSTKINEPREKTITITEKRKPLADQVMNEYPRDESMAEQLRGSPDSGGENPQNGVPNGSNDAQHPLTNGVNGEENHLPTPQGTPQVKNGPPSEDGFGGVESSRSSEHMDSDDEAGKASFKHVNRDDHGQSPIHFAASRAQGRNALSQLLEELDANIAFRDELYRTPRDLAEENGETEKLLDLLLEGYDHLLDLEIDEDIVQEVIKRGHSMTLSLLQSIPTFEERREKLHRAIRLGSDSIVREMLNKEAKDAKLLAVGKNNRGRCCLHIAILSAQENIVKIISTQFPLTLNIGDNLERTSLHYAMGVAQVETLSAILIKAGAQRTIKDLKGRTASYYFMNKSAIRALQEEESMLRV